MVEKLLFLLALVAALPVAMLTGLALVTPVTPSGALYLLGLALLVVCGLSRPWPASGRRTSRWPSTPVCWQKRRPKCSRLFLTCFHRRAAFAA
jgi:hypothetical protein